MSSHKRNTEGIKAFARKKKEMTANKVDEAIKKLIKKKEKINFNTVSINAGVSKGYLYNNNKIRRRIENLRKQQQGLPSPKLVKWQMTDASKDMLLAAKNKRIRELDDEVKRLKKELMYLRGKLYEDIS
jgi:hypothetical protein